MHISEMNFLAVEDHEFQRGVLLKVLADLGATKVSVAADGLAALKIVKAQNPRIDVIISDLDMPGMDGMEFMRHLGEASIAISIILASALERSLLASVETMAKAYGVRILGTIKKPVTPGKLEALIKLHGGLQPELQLAALSLPIPGPAFTVDEIAEGIKNDEFEAFFQPKAELATGRVIGAEALARWQHPQMGMVQPAAFIGVLEDNDQIEALTRVMLRKSAALCREWRTATGLEVCVSVNLSIKSLTDVHLAERVTELVRSESVDPKQMILEITESATTTEVAAVLENLSRLRMKGFGLSIDHYGTRNASMQQLARIAFTEIKIDRSFVANAVGQPAARVILESSLEMAKKLYMNSVAVGVETQQDWTLLKHLGCNAAQGFFVGKPMPASNFLKWARDRTRAAEVAHPV